MCMTTKKGLSLPPHNDNIKRTVTHTPYTTRQGKNNKEMNANAPVAAPA